MPSAVVWRGFTFGKHFTEYGFPFYSKCSCYTLVMLHFNIFGVFIFFCSHFILLPSNWGWLDFLGSMEFAISPVLPHDPVLWMKKNNSIFKKLLFFFFFTFPCILRVSGVMHFYFWYYWYLATFEISVELWFYSCE